MLTGSCHCGEVHWTYDGIPDRARACNCTVCRRYGAIWIYGFLDEQVNVRGTTKAYTRTGEFGGSLQMHFCGTCGCVAYWRAIDTDDSGRRMIGVNLRLSEPGEVSSIKVGRFDGLTSFKEAPSDNRCISDYWF
tara:strand:- start:91 stop:492 length:402 start_codon:yes stop_codon:yes gene_type:complete